MIVDTTLLIDLLRADPEAVETVRRLEAEGGVLWVPAAAAFELWEGVERADRPAAEQRKVERVLEDYTFLPFDREHALRAGRLSGLMVRRGQMMDPIDAQIAGTALAMGHAVLTRNRKHFEPVEGLQVVGY